MKFSAQQIADFLHGELVGDPSVEVDNLSKIEEGTPGTLTFLSNLKYTHYIYQTQASIVLVRRDFEPEQPIGATLIKVDDPYACLAMLLNLVNQAVTAKQGIEQPNYVAPSVTLPDDIYLGAFAYIGERVKIGKNVKIYPQAYIGNDVVIGDNVTLFAGVKIYHGCVIGNNCTLHAGVVIGADGFGFAPQANGEYAKIAQIGNVVLEDNVEVGANTTIDRATMGSTVIRRGVKLDNLIQIAHNVEVGEHTVIAAQAGIAGSAKVGSHSMIGGQVGVAGHIRLGNRIQVGAQSGIPNHVEDDAVIMGYPAVPSKEFARQVVYIKRLPELTQTVKALQKEIASLKEELKKQ